MNSFNYGQILGYVTATINFVLYLPQVVHVYTVKDTRSLDTKFILLQMLSCTSTLSYGVVINEMPIIVSSISILTSTCFLGYAKWILFVDSNTERFEDFNTERYDYLPIIHENLNKNERTPLKNNEFKPIQNEIKSILKKKSNSISV